jgi:hypothetical protein
MRLPFLSVGLGVALLTSLVALPGCSSAGDAESDGASSADIVGGGSNAKVTGAPSGLRLRHTPGTSGPTVSLIPNNTAVDVKCRVVGESINGNTSWDYLPKYDGYVSDAYIAKQGVASFPLCGAPSAAPLAPAPSTPPSTPVASAPAGSLADIGDDDDDSGFTFDDGSEFDDGSDFDTGSDFDPGAVTGTGGNTAAIITEAHKWLGTHETGTNCNPFSSALGRGCEAWCADFVQYVWGQAGMSTSGLTAYAGSYLSYGASFGTTKSRDASNVAPGDAVVWAHTATDAAHVGLVTEVLANGDLRVIHGNWSDQVLETVAARSSLVEGYGIAGFVSPVSQ